MGSPPAACSFGETSAPPGQPPLLTRLLQHNLGIKLVRQKSLPAERWHFSIPLKASRKVRRAAPRERGVFPA